jgi:hypothetical protein
MQRQWEDIVNEWLHPFKIPYAYVQWNKHLFLLVFSIVIVLLFIMVYYAPKENEEYMMKLAEKRVWLYDVFHMCQHDTCEMCRAEFLAVCKKKITTIERLMRAYRRQIVKDCDERKFEKC